MHRFSRFLSDFLLLSATCTFLVSVLNPFSTANYIFPNGWHPQMLRDISVTYWSYKAFADWGEFFFLTSYWFGGAYPVFTGYLGISWILVAIFLLQVLTLASGIFSLLKTRIIRIVPLISSLIMLFLMIQVYAKVRVFFTVSNYGLGYWLMYPTIFLFYFALIFHLYSRGEKTRHRPTRPLAQ
jgi:hypothetical protein